MACYNVILARPWSFSPNVYQMILVLDGKKQTESHEYV